MKWINKRTGVEQEVGQNEFVKQRILEQQGFRPAAGAAPVAPPAPTEDKEQVAPAPDLVVAVEELTIPTEAAAVSDVEEASDGQGEGQEGGQEQPLREDDEQGAEGGAIEELPRPASDVRKAGMKRTRPRDAHQEVGNL